MQKMLLALLCLCGSLAHAQTPVSLAGRPTFSQNDVPAYYIWRDGDHWHVRWSSFSWARNFAGSILADSSSLTNLRKVDPFSELGVMYPMRQKLLRVVLDKDHPAGFGPVESSNRDIRMKGKQTIRFSSRTEDSVDGFDFTTEDGVQTLTFDLKIEGKPAVGIVYVGSGNSTPDSLPLVVSLKN